MSYRVIAISGGLEKDSRASGLVRACIRTNNPHLNIQVLDISQFPLFNFDMIEENGEYPPLISACRQTVREADAVIFAVPEHNQIVSAAFKNAYDWLSFVYPMNGPTPPMNGKPGGVLVTGKTGGANTANYIANQLVLYAKMKISPCMVKSEPSQFGADGNVISEQLFSQVANFLQNLVGHIKECKSS